MTSSSDVPASSSGHVSPASQPLGIETPVTEHNVPMVSPGSIDSVASTETIRPTNPVPGILLPP